MPWRPRSIAKLRIDFHYEFCTKSKEWQIASLGFVPMTHETKDSTTTDFECVCTRNTEQGGVSSARQNIVPCASGCSRLATRLCVRQSIPAKPDAHSSDVVYDDQSIKKYWHPRRLLYPPPRSTDTGIHEILRESKRNGCITLHLCLQPTTPTLSMQRMLLEFGQRTSQWRWR